VERVYGGLVREGAALQPVDGEPAQRDVVHDEPGEGVRLDLVHRAILQQDISKNNIIYLEKI
jgi:hypothetical protein